MEQKRHPIWFTLVVGVPAIAVSSCAKTLDTSKVESDIQQAIVRQGGSSLKTVACPKDVDLAAGKTFDCVGTLDSGEVLTIPVTQTDSQGTTKWDVPNGKGLLNLAKLASLFEQTIQQEGQALTINCGEGYRSVQPGDRFECKTSKALEQSKNSQAQIEKSSTSQTLSGKKSTVAQSPATIVVTIDPQSNVSWQQVLPNATVAVASTKKSPTVETSSQTSEPQPTPTIAAQDRAKLAPNVQKTLDQVGGGDFE